MRRNCQRQAARSYTVDSFSILTRFMMRRKKSNQLVSCKRGAFLGGAPYLKVRKSSHSELLRSGEAEYSSYFQPCMLSGSVRPCPCFLRTDSRY